MSIRLTLLYFFIISLSVYAWKDWFKSLCGLIVLMAVMEHEDMPRRMMGIQGLNVWNVLFLIIFIAWLVSRNRENLRWDMPRNINILLVIYIGVIVFGVFRAIFDRSYIEDYPVRALISEELINTIKWIIPGILLFDGCRTRKRTVLALASLLIMYLMIGALVVRRLPIEAVFSGGNELMRARRKLNNEVGYHATDLSVLLAGAFWGILATLQLIRRKIFKIIVLAAAAIVILAQALTGGRAGYVAWGMTGLTMCLIKWRKYLVLAPVAIIILPMIFPGAAERMLQGFGQTNVAGETVADEEAVFAGRLTVWPYVVEKIGESPFIGYGRKAMLRTGLTQNMLQKYGESEAVNHPHNLYLETLLDNGIIGTIPILLFWIIVVINSSKLFCSKNRLCSAIGGLTLALTLTSLIAGLSGQHWYPMEHTLGIWASLFLMLRVHLEEQKYQELSFDTFNYLK